MRAKDENSSTMRPMSPTCRRMVLMRFVEDLEIVLELLGVAPAQALGAELDRGQRVLDLVRDAARDVRPGAGALRREQVGDVVERDHEALGLSVIVPSRVSCT